MNKNKSYKINYLSEQFYIDYDKTNYPEIESKSDRPYMVMLIQIENNTFAVPFKPIYAQHDNVFNLNRSHAHENCSHDTPGKGMRIFGAGF